jgi:CubicO group peptidase (beta-lactamase class C family)
MPTSPLARPAGATKTFALVKTLTVVTIVVLTALTSWLVVELERFAAAPPTVAGVALDTVVARLEAVVAEALRREGVPGISIALVGNAKLLWAKGYGVANKATGEIVTEKTVFRGASLSKTMTAYLALKLVEEGVLELDRPLIEYTGEAYIDDSRIKDVTLRMILAHTSGFAEGDTTREDLIFAPGKRWSYSNSAFWYLQWVVEHVTGQPFAQYAVDHLFSPLAMANTSFRWRDEYAALAACGYEAGGQVLQVRPVRADAAYGVLTTPSDVAQFVSAMLSPPEGDPDLLSLAGVAAMLTPQVDVKGGVYWALGWGVEVSADGDYFWHWGWVDGFRNLVVGDFDRRAAVIVITNGPGGLRAARDIVQVVFPGEHPLFSLLFGGWD